MPQKSAVACEKLMCSALVLEQATTVCFLDHRETRFRHRKIATPEVEYSIVRITKVPLKYIKKYIYLQLFTT